MPHRALHNNSHSWENSISANRHSILSRLLRKVARHAAYDSYCTKYPTVKSHLSKISLISFRTVDSCDTCEGRSSLSMPNLGNDRADEGFNSLQLRIQNNETTPKKKRRFTNLLKSRKKDGQHRVLSQPSLDELILNWRTGQHHRRLRHFCYEGISPLIRSQVWLLLVGNPFDISRELFNDCLHQYRSQVLLLEHRSRSSNNQNSRKQSSCYMCSFLFSKINPIPEQRELSLVYKCGCVSSPIDKDASVGSNESCSSTSRYTAMRILDPGPSNTSPSRVYCCDRSLSLQSVRLDISRTFPELQLFQCGAPYHQALHDLLSTYMAYQPAAGYVQGMSFLAAVLLLVTGHLFDAVLVLTSIMNRPCHRAYYSAKAEEESVVYLHAFDRILATRLPHLHAHFKNVGLEPNMYLFDWFFTLFSRLLPLQHALRVWDLFFLDSELALFRAALSILHHYEARLLQSSFDQLVVFLVNPLPGDWAVEELVSEMQSIDIKAKFMTTCLTEAHASLENPLMARHKSRYRGVNPFPLHPGSSVTALRYQSAKSTTMCLDSVDLDIGRPTYLSSFPSPVDHTAHSLYSPASSCSSSLNGSPDNDDYEYPFCLQLPKAPAIKCHHTSKTATFVGARSRQLSHRRLRFNGQLSEWSLNLGKTHLRSLSSSASAVKMTHLCNEYGNTAADTHFSSVWPLHDASTFSRVPLRSSVERVP